MAEINSFYKSKYTGEQLDRALDNIYDSVLVDGSKPMTGALTIKKADNGHARFDKDHTATADAGTVVEDVDKNGNTAAILLRGADKSARLKFGATNYEMLHSGNIQPYIVPYAQTAEQAAEAAENALEGVREAIENIPEGTATPIVNDLTTGGESMALSAEMGKVLGQRPNPNLLDNGYFVNPVNQRGQTEYAGAGYTIDRWQSNSGNVTKSIVEGGVKLTAKASTYGWIFWQILKIPADVIGQHNTGSLLVTELIGTAWRFSISFRNASDAEISSSTITVSSNLTIPSAVIPQGTVYIRVGVYVSSGAWLAAGDTITLRAAKLELGTQQTLAHQDASGNWVLNEIPDYNEQLLRCITSTADGTDEYANKTILHTGNSNRTKLVADDSLPEIDGEIYWRYK